MRGDVPANLESVWRSGNYVGVNRPMGRVTVRRPQMDLTTWPMQSTFRRVPMTGVGVGSFNPYPQGIDPTRGEPITNVYADYLFTPPSAPKELPNVKSISWDRTTDSDVAEATIEFWNTAPLPLGQVPTTADLDQPGYYTPTRGDSAFSSRWKHKKNEWAGMLMPDNILVTYEGYGFDPNLPPERDPHLTQTGVWMIDRVRMSSRGTLVAKCRDLGRLLLDHISFIPVVPDDFYPVSFKDWTDKVTVQSERNVIIESNNTERLPIAHLGTGNDLWPESSYPGARLFGHAPAHAYDDDPGSYWLSIGAMRPTQPAAYEYLEFTPNGATVSEVRFDTVGVGYNVYVCVETADGWLGQAIVPYRRAGYGRYTEGMPYIAFAGGLGGEFGHRIVFGEVKGVTRIRVWFHNLQRLGIPGDPYRAAVRSLSAWGPVYRREVKTVVDVNQVNLKPGPAGSNPGTVRDYTDIVKLFCAWAGLFWPADAKVRHSDGATVPLEPKSFDTNVLGGPVRGRVWGDFQQTGTAPPYEVTAANFDKKTLMDGVAYVREILGFLFHIDETGGAVWRLPNYWSLGNWISGMSARPGRTSKILTIDERQVLMNLDAEIQSTNVREGVFVANAVGKMAAMVGGYNPNPTGLRRVAGWTDQNFSSVAEARVMADLVAVRQMFRYRTDQVRIPANPMIQIDDQIRIFERTTSEGFVHYVKGISSSLDTQSGRWEYTLQTNWLGDDPDGKWVIDKSTLDSTTQAYVDALSGGIQWERGQG